MKTYLEILAKYNVCTCEKERQKLWNIMSDIIEYRTKESGSDMATAMNGLLPLLKWFEKPTIRFQRRTPAPMKWSKGYMKPKARLKLTRLILDLWRPKRKRVLYAISNGNGFILSGKKILKMQEEDLERFITRKYATKLSTKENKQINRKVKNLRTTNIIDVIDFIAPVGKCRGEPKRLAKCWR